MMREFETVDQVFETLINELTAAGEPSNDRTGVGTVRLFGFAAKIKFMHNKLMAPLFKPANIVAAAAELYCWIRGISDVDELKRLGCPWWEGNLATYNERKGTPGNRDLGEVYGKQWMKKFMYNGKEYDQLTLLIERLKNDNQSRKMYVSSWNPNDFDVQALEPCYHGFQCFVNANNELTMMFHMRSCDVILGLPHNIVFHQLLLILLANECGYAYGDLLFTLGDYHLYNNSKDAVEEFRKRLHKNWFPAESSDRPSIAPLEHDTIDSFHPLTLQLMKENYKPMPNIKVPMAV